jgi:hypothetical protein
MTLAAGDQYSRQGNSIVGSQDMTFLFAILIVLGFAYLFPTFIAMLRGHRNAGGVFAVNLLLGWTLIGWGAALIWSFGGDTHSDRLGTQTSGEAIRIEPAKVTQRAMATPEPFLADGVINGNAYREERDGSVIVVLNGSPVKFRNKAAAEAALSS